MKNSITTRKNVSTNKYHKMRKATMVVLLSLMAAVLMSCFAVTAYATTGNGGTAPIVNTTAFINTAERVLTAIICLTGAGILFFGIYNIAEANSEENPAGKTKGIKMIASGIGIIIIAVTLIPVLMDMMRGAV